MFYTLIFKYFLKSFLSKFIIFVWVEFISKGKTLLNYMGKTDRHLSFRQNEDIKILGKPVDINGPDWIGTVKNNK